MEETGLVATGLDKEDVNDLVSYIQGDSTDIPDSLSRIMTNLYQKMQISLGYNIASQTQRMIKLQKFIATAEEELYDPDQIPNMDKESLVKTYNSANKALGDMNELTRRFLAQNKDTFKSTPTEQEKLAQKLITLSPEKIEAIMKIINADQAVVSTSNDEDGIL